MKRLIFCGLMIFICLPAVAQTDINRYTLFTGFDYMISPARNLTQRGFESDFGITVKPWLGLGADFGISGEDILTGAGTINGSETVFSPALKNIQIDPNSIHVAFKSTTYTLAAGPQLYFRLFEKVTFFARPGFGLIHESANIAFPPQLVGLRFAADWVNTHLFSDLLVGRQNYIRFSVGPTFRWGQLKQSR